MKKTTVKLLSLLLALAMTLSLVGCIKAPEQTPAPTAAAQTTAPTETPAPQTQNDSEMLKELDMKFFLYLNTQDVLSYRLTFRNPETFGINDADIPRTFGDLSRESNEEYFEYIKALKTELDLIDRENLDENEKMTYDVIAQTIETDLLEEDFYLYYEPLTEYSGTHSNLPFYMTFMPMETKADVENYLALLEDLPRYLRQIIQYEKDKSQAGIFMRDSAADEIIKNCNDIINSGKNSFLLSTFEASLGKIEGLTQDEISAYKERNNKAVTKEMVQAYTELRDALKSLKGTRKVEGGLASWGEEGKRYFEIGLMQGTSSKLSVEGAMRVIADEIDDEIADIILFLGQDRTLEQKYYTKLNIGSTEFTMKYLKEFIADYYPELPEHTIEYMDVPKELEEQYSPASYLIPPIDDITNNKIQLNKASYNFSDELMLTLGHEGYPGHLFQYVYQRSKGVFGYTPQTLGLTAYYEGWAQYSEFIISLKNTKIDNRLCQFKFFDGVIMNVLLSAYVSMGVNGLGWDLTATKNKLAEMGFDYQGLAEQYFSFAVDMPFYYIEYGAGYAQMMQLYRNTSTKLGDNFDLKEFNTMFLDIGPGQFNLVKDRVDAWIAAKLEEIDAAA